MASRVVRLFGSQARGHQPKSGALRCDLLVVMGHAFRLNKRRECGRDHARSLGDLPISKDIVIATPDEITWFRGRRW